MTKKTNAMRRLDREKVRYDIRTFEVSEMHVDGEEVAKKIDVPSEFVYKTLVLENKQHEHFVFVIPVSAHLDMKKAAQAVRQKKLQLMPLDDLKRVTGYVRGGCSPIGMKAELPTVFDNAMFAYDCIFVSAGQRGIQMGVNPDALATVAHAHRATVTITAE
ncbi:Cys-tRNA(Pro) deacylase [Staphylococcus ratti]|uniref:Cys-tRNA(Pro)/Cys-tRNA(Cys) deacylase n=1 Tax=Staphylococcus ratti TaxID=2892440 RepID=A0ABY3PBX3_9STAP|nr:Cys-tRNA(Pro) deacylase [Staphylococcus ratti]UEX89791.1 Cys-tRNA(Pro) deacylase [Staphylococcus ratti]